MKWFVHPLYFLIIFFYILISQNYAYVVTQKTIVGKASQIRIAILDHIMLVYDKVKPGNDTVNKEMDRKK